MASEIFWALDTGHIIMLFYCWLTCKLGSYPSTHIDFSYQGLFVSDEDLNTDPFAPF